MAALAVWQGWDATLAQMAWFFTKAALLTFGGAYAVLPFVTQAAVQYGWVTAAERRFVRDLWRAMHVEERKLREEQRKAAEAAKEEKDGVLYYVIAGKDVAKRAVRRCVVTKYSDFEGDAKSEDEAMEEKVTVKFLEVARREKIS